VRIVHFTDTYLPRRDGVITSVRTLVAAQSAAGHRALTVVPRHRDQPAGPDLLRLRAMPVGRADLRVSPWLLRDAAARGTLRRIAEFAPDILHVHTPGPIGLLGVLAAGRLGIPLVQTYHTDLHAYAEAYRIPVPALRMGLRLYARRLDAPRPSLRPAPTAPASGRRSRASAHRHAALDACNGLLLGDADAVVVPSRVVLDRITLPVPADRIHIVPTAVAPYPVTARALAAFRARHRIGPAEPVVLFVGRVNREKGMDLLLSAFEHVVARRPDARLVLVGAVYEPRWLAGLLRAAGPAVAARTVLAGEQPPEAVAAACAAARVFAFPSRTDTQALVLQEAALVGLPAVVADPVLHRRGPLGGHAVHADATPEAFGAAVADLLTDGERAAALGSAAAAHVAGYTPAAYAEAMHAVYRRASSPRLSPLEVGAARPH